MGLLTPGWRRRLRQGQHQVESLGAQAEGLSERYFFRRLDRLVAVRRFVVSWLLFFVLVSGVLVGQIRALDSHFQSLQPVPGGIYTEGLLGEFTNANPLYASGDVDETVSKLLFAGLLSYDQNNKLVGDLAESWSMDQTGRVYTVKLRQGLFWHDGAPLTSRDVIFTYRMIQNPDALSSLNASWKGIQITAVDDRTVKFTLPNVLSSFPYHLTNGLIPEHILKNTAPGDLRAVGFNTLEPVGSGPFAWKELEISGNSPETREVQIALRPFEKYHRGKPKLGGFVVHSFRNAESLERSFLDKEITAASFVDVPESLQENPKVVTYDFTLSAANMVFFRNGSKILSDPALRKALIQGADTRDILISLGYPARPVRSPLLQGQLGYDKSVVQPSYDKKAAAASLEALGWKLGKNGIRMKAGQPLRFELTAPDTAEARLVTAKLKQHWRAIGVNAAVKLQASDELQRTIASDNYDALLYGIEIGVDPDVFVYWHSSQDDPRSNQLNFSEYNSKTADEALEAGRTRIEDSLRVVKYKPFLQAWQKDAPALGLYQPKYTYVTQGQVYGLEERTINQDVDRLIGVHQWQIRQAATTNDPKSLLR